jgi:hypothetical protein
MKRDWSIIRSILIRLESSETPFSRVHAADLAEHQTQAVAYNMVLLNDAGCIEAR